MSQRNCYWHLSPSERIYFRDRTPASEKRLLGPPRDLPARVWGGEEVKSTHPWHLIAVGVTRWISDTDDQGAERRWEDPNGLRPWRSTLLRWIRLMTPGLSCILSGGVLVHICGPEIWMVAWPRVRFGCSLFLSIRVILLYNKESPDEPVCHLLAHGQ